MIIQDYNHNIQEISGDYHIVEYEGSINMGSQYVPMFTLVDSDRLKDAGVDAMEMLDKLYELIKPDAEFISIPELLNDFETQL